MAEKGLLDGENVPSAEANMIRDELRHAARAADDAATRLIAAIDHGEEYLQGRRRRPNIHGIAAPPDAYQVRE